MTQYVINIGALPNDGTGDPLRTAFNDVNLNFNQVWATGLIGSNIAVANNTILTTNTNGNLVLNPNGIGNVIANAHVVPDRTRVRNLGAPSRYWDTLYVWYANVSGNLTVSGGITVGGPATVNGDVLINGNLQVEGTTTTIDSTVVDIKDKNITLAFGSPNAQVANGGGITIAGANALWYYNYPTNSWTSNLGISTPNITFPDGSVLDTANTVYIGQTPNGKGDGNLWFNSNDGRGYVKYNNQWIEFSPTVIPNPSVYLGNLTINGANNSTLYFPPGGEIVFGDGTSQNTAFDANSITFTNVASSIIPAANVTYSLGNSTRWWTNAWFSSNTLYIGGVPIGVSGSNLTVAGANVVTANASGTLDASDISVTGNVTAGYFYGDGSNLTGLPAGYSNANAASFMANFGGNNITWQGGSTIFEDTVLVLQGNVGVGITSPGATQITAGPNNWYFNADGSTTLPGSAGFVVGAPGQLKTNDANTTALDFRDSTGRGFYTNNDGYTLRSNGSENWIFGTNGIVTLPDNTNMGTIEGPGTFGFYNNNANTEFLIELGPTNAWGFNGASGNLTVPGNINYIGASPAPSINGFDTVNVANIIAGIDIGAGRDISATGNITGHDITASGNINGAGTLNIDGNTNIGGNLFVTGNINFSGNVTQITGNSGVFYGDAQTGVGALYAGKQGFTALPNTVVQVTGDDSSYVQVNLQNTNHSNVASMDMIVTADDGNDTSNYIDMGIASSTWDGTQTNSLGTAVKNRDGYLYVQGGSQGGNLVLGATTAGYSVKFNAGGPGSANTVAEISNVGILTTGVVSATGNVRGANINTAGAVSAAGNITGNYILGNGSQLTGLPSTSPSGSNTYVQFNDNGSFGGSGGLTFDKSSGNLNVNSGFVNAAAVITSGRIGAGTSISAAGNVTGGNILTAGLISATGNITGNYVLGNAAFMTGIPASYGNSNVATFLAAFGSNTISTTGNITSGNIALTGNLTVNGAPIYGAPASYAKYTRSTTQTGAVANTVIVCNVSENTFGSDIAVNTGTGQVTLTAGRTYRLRGSIVGFSGAGTRPAVMWYNETGSAWIGESAEAYGASDAASNGSVGGTAEAVFTANATTVVSFRVLSVSSAITLGGNSDFSLNGSYPWIDIEVIGGQAPITGFSTTGNITGGNIITTGYVSATGNITGNYFIGNGSQLTGLPAGYGNANLANIGSNAISTTGNISAGYLFGNGSQLTGLPSSYSNSNVATFLAAYGSNTISTSGNITAGNLIGNISITGNVTGTSANVSLVAGSYTWTFDNTGNLTIPAGGDILLGNAQSTISAAGNITGAYIFGNGSQLTGLPAGYGNANLANIGSNAISTTGNVSAGYFIGNGSALTGITATANLSGLSGNINWTATNANPPTFTTASAGSRLILWPAVNGSNVDYAIGIESGATWFSVPQATGSFQHKWYGGTTQAMVLTGDGNLSVTGTVITTGNITGGNLRTGGQVSATGNITSGNVLTTGLISATGAVFSSSITTGPITSNNTISGNLIQSSNNITIGAALQIIGSTNTFQTVNGSAIQFANRVNFNATGTSVAATGNIIGGNILTAGLISASGNVTGGNLILPAVGQITSTAGTNGNITINPDGTGLFVVTSITPAVFGNTLSVAGNVTVSGTGAVSMPNLPAFRVYGNGVTSVSTTTNTTGVLNGNNWAVDYNQGSYLNSTTGTFTAPVAGLYQINLVARVANNVAPTAQAIVIKNRTGTSSNQVMWEAAANPTINHFGVSTVSKLAAGDTLNLVVTVGALTFDVNDNWSVAFLG